ncbi:aromatic amino acid lyase [Candidatus Poriferisodalis sp.]|uniref:aromatic amino acid lyase n=1 Tax=Candidatus Poriferisodalis sp. TaxID=3101277 RepID=UPI003B5C772A
MLGCSRSSSARPASEPLRPWLRANALDEPQPRDRRARVPASRGWLAHEHLRTAGAARKLRRAIANLRRILAIEWVTAARGIELRSPLQPAAGTAAALNLLRSEVPGPGPDRWLSPELAAADQLLADEALVPAVETTVGPLA